MKQYLVIHKDFTPEEMQGGKPRDLNGVYFVHSDQDGSVTPNVEIPVDEQGQSTLTLEQEVATIAKAMYAETPIIRLRRTEALALLDTPQWKIYIGDLESTEELTNICTIVGLTVIGATLPEQVTNAQNQLKTLLTV